MNMVRIGVGGGVGVRVGFLVSVRVRVRVIRIKVRVGVRCEGIDCTPVPDIVLTVFTWQTLPKVAEQIQLGLTYRPRHS